MLLFKRIEYIIRNEGWIALIEATTVFLRYKFFFYKTYYIYITRLDATGPPASKPEIEDFTLSIIETPEQLDEKIAAGYNLIP